MRRAKDIVESVKRINEAEIRSAVPQFMTFSQSVGGVFDAINSAYGAVANILAMAEAADDAIDAATSLSYASNIESNAIVDNISAAQSVDPSQSIITLRDHQNGVEEACRILSSLKANLGSMMMQCKRLSQLAGKQFVN